MNFVNKIDDRLRNHLWGCKIYVTLCFITPRKGERNCDIACINLRSISVG